MMETIIGKRVPRIDGPAKVTGEAKYTVDIRMPGMLCAKILRSPLPHARILNIDIAKASRIPGVKAVITGKDAWDVRHGFVETPRYPADQYVLANDRVRYLGEEVAAVAAVDEDTAIEAIDAIDVSYEELPAVFDLFEAMEPGAPEIHPVEIPDLIGDFRNIGGQCANSYGDVEGAFARAHLVRKDRFEPELRTHCYLEPQATVAHYDAAGILHVWTSGMGTFRKRMQLSRILNIPANRVHVHKSWVGGAFGGKIDLFSHEFCASLLSMKTGKPVRYAAEREEVFSYFRHSQNMIVDLETAVDREGVLLGQRVRCYNDCGAYRGSGVVLIFTTWGYLVLPYRMPALDYIGYSVYTNNPVRAPQRGHAAPKIRFAGETQMDMIAADLGIDPVTIRLRNARKPGEVLPNGDNIKKAGLIECIRQAAEETDFARKYEENRTLQKAASHIKHGIGMGASGYFTGTLIYPNNSAAVVKFNDDGTVHLLTGALDIGQGAETVLAQIVAQELGLGMEDIQVVSGDTNTTPVDIGSWISGLTLVTGNAVKKAAEDARGVLLASASKVLQAAPVDLELGSRRVFVKGTDRSISFAQAVARHIRDNDGDPIVGRGYSRALKEAEFGPSLKNAKGTWSESYAFDAQVAEVEVDTRTGQIRIIKAFTAHDCGFPINPLLVEGQIDGQASMAAGQALAEEVIVKEGVTLNPSFLDYKLPTAHEMIEAQYADVITETYERDREFVTKEVGEGYVSGILGAISNAVANATGKWSTKLPIKIAPGKEEEE
jgi:CO/xanthine dehydrogenase Mo-binding subunit